MTTKPHPNDLAAVPSGWTARAWAERLRQLATACADVNPARAKELRDATILVDARADRDDALLAPAITDPFLYDLTTLPPEVPAVTRY